MTINLEKIFTFKFARCHKDDNDYNPCFDKVAEEFEEFVDAYNDYDELRVDFRNMGITTLEELEEAEKDMMFELLDIVQASVTMMGHLRNKGMLTKEIVDDWKEKQKEREKKYIGGSND